MMNLSDIFTIVLENAIEAQYNANLYSAEIAKKQKLKIVETDDTKFKDVSYFPIPNSMFQNVNVNLKLKLGDLKTDLSKSYKNIFSTLQNEAPVHIHGIHDILKATNSIRLVSELIKLQPKTDDQHIVKNVVKYFSLYIYHYEDYLKSEEYNKSRHKDIVHVSEAVYSKVTDSFNKEKGEHNARYYEINHTLNLLSKDMSPYKNMEFHVDNFDADENTLCDIGMSVDMRTFSWANYDK